MAKTDVQTSEQTSEQRSTDAAAAEAAAAAESTKLEDSPRLVDVFDGGAQVLDLSVEAAGKVIVTDLTTGRVVDRGDFVVSGKSVKKTRGVWARGARRWRVEHGKA